jgi:hypothetical protein
LACPYRVHSISLSHSIAVLVIAKHIHPAQLKHGPKYFRTIFLNF